MCLVSKLSRNVNSYFLCGLCVRHERAQLQESQYLPDKRQAREHTDGAETEWETLPGGFSRKREGNGKSVENVCKVTKR